MNLQFNSVSRPILTRLLFLLLAKM